MLCVSFAPPVSGSRTVRTLLVAETSGLGSSFRVAGLSVSLSVGGFGGPLDELAKRMVFLVASIRYRGCRIGDAGLRPANLAPNALSEARRSEVLNMLVSNHAGGMFGIYLGNRRKEKTSRVNWKMRSYMPVEV